MGRHNFDLPLLYGKHYAEGMVTGKISAIRNIINNAEDREGHHCSTCEKSIKPSCIKKLHMAFCTTLTYGSDGDGGIQLRMCGCRFAPESPSGCMKHTYAQGHNAWIKAAWKNREHRMPRWLPHWEAGFIYVEAGTDEKSKPRKPAESTSRYTTIRATPEGKEIAKGVVDELNRLLYPQAVAGDSPETLQDNLAAASSDSQGFSGVSKGSQSSPVASTDLNVNTEDLFAQPMSAAARQMLTDLGVDIDPASTGEVHRASPPKEKIALTPEEECDPQVWNIYEAHREAKLKEQQLARQRERAQENDDVEETRKRKSRRKQPIPMSAAEVRRRRS